MVNFLLLTLGLIDLIAGGTIILSPNLILLQIAGYVGWILIAKGIWSILFSLG